MFDRIRDISDRLISTQETFKNWKGIESLEQHQILKPQYL